MVMMLLALALSTAQAAEPTGTLTLACQGTVLSGAGTSWEINIGVIVNEKGLILDDDLLKIYVINETKIEFGGSFRVGHMHS